MCLTGDNPKLHHCATVPSLKKGERFAPPAGSDVVRAWRIWKLALPVRGDQRQRPSLLTSAHATSHQWKPGEPMRAHAAIKADREKIGVHAVKRREDLAQVGLVDRNDKTLVIGEVVLWGDVAEHENGYRGEYGYPLRLWTNDFLATVSLRDSYGVAVEVQSARDVFAVNGRR